MELRSPRLIRFRKDERIVLLKGKHLAGGDYVTLKSV